MGWRVVWGCMSPRAALLGYGSTQTLDHKHFRKTLQTGCVSFPFLTSRGHLVFLDLRLAGWLGEEYKKEARVFGVLILWLRTG